MAIVVEQVSTVVTGSGGATSQTFNRVAGDLIIVCCLSAADGYAISSIKVDGTNATLVASCPGLVGNVAAICTRVASGSGTSSATVRTWYGASYAAITAYKVTGYLASDPIGAGLDDGVVSQNNATPTLFTAEGNGSCAFVVANDTGVRGSPTSSDLTASPVYSAIGGVAGLFGYKPVDAGAVTANMNAYGTTGTTWQYCGVEILATPDLNRFQVNNAQQSAIIRASRW